MKTPIHPAVKYFLLTASILFTLFSCWNLYKLIQIRYFSEKTTGTFIKYNTKIGEAKFKANRKEVYAPIFSFKIKKDSVITINSNYFTKSKKYNKGDKVTVYYHKNRVNDAKIDISFPWKSYLLYLAYGVAGLFLTLTPILNWKK